MAPYELVKEIYEDRLRQAEKRRLYTQQAPVTPSSARRLLLYIGETLIRFGVRLIEVALVYEMRKPSPGSSPDVL